MPERIGQPADQHSPGVSEPHPTAPIPPAAEAALARLERAFLAPADPATIEKVRTALGFRRHWKPNGHLGETATQLTMWSQMELNALYERVGGTVSTRQAERTTSDGTSWTATELTVTVQVDGVGPVEISTDIEDDPEHGYRTDVPVVAVARYQQAAAHLRDLAAHADYEGCEYVRDEMTMCYCQLAAAGRLDLIGAHS